MRKYLFSVILVCSATTITAQSLYGTIHTGCGPLGNSNASYIGIGIAANTGLDITYMASRTLGIASGIGLSYHYFDISYNHATVANQSLVYVDLPLAIRYTPSRINSKQRVHGYIQPGVKISFLRRAHYEPSSGGSNAIPHITFEQDNNDEFLNTSVRPFLQGGFLFHISKSSDFTIGYEFSTATQNIIKNTSYNRNDKMVQGYPANMHLTYANFQIGFLYRLADYVVHTSIE